MNQPTSQESKLAIDGGTPVRDRPLPPNYPGASVMGTEEAEAANRVIMARSPFRFYGSQPQHAVQELESRIAKDLGVSYVLGVTSATAGLIVALKALGIGYGDKVIVPSITFIATATAVICCGAVPVFAEVDESLSLDPDDLPKVMDEEVKAIIAVPLIGTPVDMDPIMAFAKKHGIPVIEDVAQSCGIEYKGRPQGTIGDIGVFSFQMNKVLTAGEGGALLTNDPKLYERAVRYHDQGMFRPAMAHHFELDFASDEAEAFAGQNYRMSEITGAVLVEQWKKLDPLVTGMRRHGKQIRDALRRTLPSLQLRGSCDEEGELGSHVGMILPDEESAVRFHQALNAENVSSLRLYMGKPVYRFPSIYHQRVADQRFNPFDYPFKHPVKYAEGLCPRAESLIARTVFVPVSAALTEADTLDIVRGITKVYRGLGMGEGRRP